MLYTNHFLMELCFIGHVILKVILVSWMPDIALYVTTFFTTYNAKASGIMLVFPMLQIGFSLHPLTRPSLIDNDVACYVHRSIKMHIFILPDPHISFYMMMASLSKEVKSCVTNHDLDFTRWDTQVPLTRVVP